MTTTTAPTATESVTAALTTNPDGMTTRSLADATGLTVAVVSKALTSMEADGTARRDANPNGRKSADTWHSATPVDAAPAADTTPGTETTEDADAPAAVTLADEPGDTPAPADEATLPEAPVSAPPVVPRKTDLKVMIMAGVLGDHPDGITADEAIDESGLALTVGEVILAAMEAAAAAHRLPIAADGTELWVPGDNTDLATVDLDNAPTSPACPTCGQERKIRRVAMMARRTTTAPARPAVTTASEINTDGSTKLAKGELERIVEAFHRDLGTGHELTPGTIAKAIGRSPGAIVNSQRKLSAHGVLVMTRPAPETYAMADNAPAPAADVRALMAPPVTVPAADSGDTATNDEAGNDTPGTDTTDTTPAAAAA
ncbi:hypothetical protein FB565_002955 [Actinoplanes lutulentus]|uniref:Uncharacterized protein n=1 Tax=Actinoplanes lutulentus TaxID=1287878 RepID=A0A327Z2R3_9ACTN|nr:hypothetical protein [Actinoplanes lutulentus]MBB2943242.1 hypothetical protein [Actinoplanes lutulentus]RAK28303.1 hypothetical protein B0I29_12071 [Actinoplanes lutulentus]